MEAVREKPESPTAPLGTTSTSTFGRGLMSTLGAILGRRRSSVDEDAGVGMGAGAGAGASTNTGPHYKMVSKRDDSLQPKSKPKSKTLSKSATAISALVSTSNPLTQRFRPIFDSASSDSSNKSITIEMRNKNIYDEYGRDGREDGKGYRSNSEETDIDDIPETYDGESSAHRHKHPKITKADLIDLMESMDTIKQQIMEADFERMEEFYMTNYTLASLYQIADYYKLRRRVLKPAMVQDIVVYETNLDHFEVVYKRRKLWAYMEELKADEYLGRFINIQLGCE